MGFLGAKGHHDASLDVDINCECCMVPGHVAGLLVGAYLGAGLSPKLVSMLDKHSIQESADEGKSAKLDVMHVSHKGALRRWAAYASFAATLLLVAAGTVVTRTGELPIPKGLDLLALSLQ